MYNPADWVDPPSKAPAGYEWERVPGRPGRWMLVRLPLDSAVWVAAREADLQRFLRTVTIRD